MTVPMPAARKGAARPPVTPMRAAPATEASPTFHLRDVARASAFFLVSASALSCWSAASSRPRATASSSPLERGQAQAERAGQVEQQDARVGRVVLEAEQHEHEAVQDQRALGLVELGQAADDGRIQLGEHGALVLARFVDAVHRLGPERGRVALDLHLAVGHHLRRLRVLVGLVQHLADAAHHVAAPLVEVAQHLLLELLRLGLLELLFCIFFAVAPFLALFLLCLLCLLRLFDFVAALAVCSARLHLLLRFVFSVVCWLAIWNALFGSEGLDKRRAHPRRDARDQEGDVIALVGRQQRRQRRVFVV